MSCQAKAKYQYVDRLPTEHNAKTVFGTVIHHALEQYNNTRNLDRAIDTFHDWWDNPEKAGYPDHGRWPRGSNFGGLRRKGEEILRHQHLEVGWDKREVLATEHGFCVPFGEHELIGYVDLLEVRRSGNGNELLRVVDYKSGSWKPNRGALALDLQFTVYDYASRQPEFWVGGMDPDFPGLPNGQWLWETHKDMPRRNIWWHLMGPKEIDAGSRDETDFKRMYLLCEQIQRAYEVDLFIPTIGEACVLCDFNEQCGVSIPTEEETRQEQLAWI